MNEKTELVKRLVAAAGELRDALQAVIDDGLIESMELIAATSENGPKAKTKRHQAMSPAAAAKYIKSNWGYSMHGRAISRACDRGQMTHMKIGRHRFISPQAIAGFMKRHLRMTSY